MFFSRNKKNNVYPCKLQFYYIKVGFRGSKLYRHVFVTSLSLKHAQLLSKAMSNSLLKFPLGLWLTQANSIGTGKTAQMRRLA